MPSLVQCRVQINGLQMTNPPAKYYPIFHRTSVTKGRLLTILAIPITVEITLVLLSFNNFVIPYQVAVLIFIIIIIPPMLFMNCKLFAVARKSRKNNGISPEMKKTFSLKTISSCLLAVVCFVVLNIPVFVYIGLTITLTEKEFTLDNAALPGFWASTIASMNSTFNCLIFYWKNKILRTERMKVIKGMEVSKPSLTILDKVENSWETKNRENRFGFEG